AAGSALRPRSRTRYTVGRETENSSEMLCSPAPCSCRRWVCCRVDSLGCLPLSLPLALATAIPSRVRILSRSTPNSAKVARMLENLSPMGSVGVADRTAERQPHAALGEGVADVAGVGHGAGEAVEFRDDESVAGADCGEGLGRGRVADGWCR